MVYRSWWPLNFKLFIFPPLSSDGFSVATTKAAKRLVESHEPVVWDILEEVIREHPVLLNRAPTLHRLGIQAFEPVLIEGKAIQLHPLCVLPLTRTWRWPNGSPRAAITRGTSRVAHLDVSVEQQILFPASGEPSIVPSQDIVLGLYYTTRARVNGKGEGSFFADINELHRAYSSGAVELQSRVTVRLNEWTKDENGEFQPQLKRLRPMWVAPYYLRSAEGLTL